MPSKSDVKHLLQALIQETDDRTTLIYAGVVLFLISLVIVFIIKKGKNAAISSKESGGFHYRPLSYSVIVLLASAIFLAAAQRSAPRFELDLTPEQTPITGLQIEMDDGEPFENLPERDRQVFSQYYFENRILWVSEDIRKLISGDIFVYALPERNIVEETTRKLSAEETSWLRTIEYYESPDQPLVWIAGSYWAESRLIHTGQDADGILYFIPQSALDKMSQEEAAGTLRQHSGEVSQLPANQRTEYPPSVMIAAAQIPGRDLRQLCFFSVLFLIGAALCLLNPCHVSPLAGSVLSFPLGSGLVSCLFAVLTFLQIPVTLLTLAISVLLFLTVYGLIIRHRSGLRSRKTRELMLWAGGLLIFLLLGWFCIQKRIIFTTSDSRSIIIIAHRLAIYGSGSGDFLSWFSARGFFTASIIALGYLSKIDIPYALFPLLFVVLCLMVPALLWEMLSAPKRSRLSRRLRMALCFLSFLLTFFCQALRIHEYWILNNLPAAIYLLIFLYAIVHAHESEQAGGLIFGVISAMVIICLRSEGAIHIAFFLCLFPLLKKKLIGEKAFLLSIALWTWVWNLVNFLTFGLHYESYFWSSAKGALVCLGMLAPLGINWLSDGKYPISSFLTRHYKVLFICGLIVLCAASMFVRPDFLLLNTQVFLSHFLSPSLCALSIFLLAVLPLALSCNDPAATFLCSCVFSYMILTFCIFLFRSDAIHTGYTDSAMRLIVQIIPSAVLSTIYSISTS